MKTTFLLLAFAFSVCVGQTYADGSALSLTASIPSEVSPFRPVSVDLILKNVGTNSIRVLRFPNATSTEVQVQAETPSKIIYKGRVEVSRSHESERPEPSPVNLNPGEQYSFRVSLKCRWSESGAEGAIFDRSGLFKLRFVVPVTYSDSTNKNWIRIESDWMSVSVKELRPSETEAIKKLLSSANYCWLFEPQEAVMFTSEKEQAAWENTLSNFIEVTPASYWTAYAHVALAFLEEHRALQSKSREEKLRWLASAKRHVDLALTDRDFSDAEKTHKIRDALDAQEKLHKR